MKRTIIMNLCLLAAALVFAALSFAQGKEISGDNGFYFVQMSDTHWGFNDPAINPDYAGTLKKAINEVNAMDPAPDFVVFTGDLIQGAKDPEERRKRMLEFKEIVKTLKVKELKFLPGEHDAAMDKGAVFTEIFGKTHYTFDHKNVHFIVLDNVSNPTSSVGDQELAWLKTVLLNFSADSRIIIFTHRPLFELNAQWDWWTSDGERVMAMFKPFKNVTVFYGHIHNENTHITDGMTFHAAKGLMYQLPWPGTAPKKAPVAWDPQAPYRGLGFRSVHVLPNSPNYDVLEYPITTAEGLPQALPTVEPMVFHVTARDYAFEPQEINVKKDVPVVIDLSSQDELHGFYCHDLGLRSDIVPGEVRRVRFTPHKAGVYLFSCDVHVGEGDDEMTGKIIVQE